MHLECSCTSTIYLFAIGFMYVKSDLAWRIGLKKNKFVIPSCRSQSNRATCHHVGNEHCIGYLWSSKCKIAKNTAVKCLQWAEWKGATDTEN